MIAENEKTSDRIYDTCAETYGFDVTQTLAARLKLELAQKCIGAKDDVLDVGCANGLFMKPLLSRCRHIAGIDINDRMLEAAQRALAETGATNFSLYKRSATSLEFPDESFDTVLSLSTMLLVPDTAAALREIARVLKSGGHAVLDVAGRYNLSRIYWSWYYRRNGHFGVNSFSYSAIQRQLAAVGLAVEESHALGFADQWRYVPGLHKLKALEGLFHAEGPRDLDYRISNHPWLFPLANRWYLLCRKTSL